MNASPRAVAVFGGSQPRPGDAAYEMARQLGSELAARGLTVVNGGYGGVMEAASRGAREAGGRAVGVTTDWFSERGGGNRYLTEEIREADLFLRTRTLLHLSDGFVVLSGRAGTLAELAFLWALHRADRLGPRPTVLLGPDWRSLVEMLHERGILEDGQRRVTRFASSAKEAADLVTLGMESFDRFCSGEHEA